MTTTVEAPAVIEPGIYDDLTADEYHADSRSLSSSGARKLLPPSCPALFKWERDNGRTPKKTFDFGHAAHTLTLGEGPQLVVVDAPLWNTNAIKAEVAAIRAEGNVPLKTHEYEQIQAMAMALRQHPIAGPLFEPGTGVAELSGFWKDGPSGIIRRFRTDWMKHLNGSRRILADYKTCLSASLEAISRSVNEYGYHCQDAWYRDGVIALDLGDEDTAQVFVFQEKQAPYLVTVVELTRDDIRRGREKNRRAIDTYAECTETGIWPGYSNGVEPISLPIYAQIRHDEEYS